MAHAARATRASTSTRGAASASSAPTGASGAGARSRTAGAPVAGPAESDVADVPAARRLRMPRIGGALGARAVERLGERVSERLGEFEPPRVDWGRVGVFGAGLAVGTLLGAGLALLAAPAPGWETRARLARQAKRAGLRLSDGWDDLGYAVRRSGRGLARRVRR